MKHDESREQLPLATARWRIEAAKVPGGGLKIELAADATERKALAAALDLLALDQLLLKGLLTGLSRGRFRLVARLQAEFAQPCVVTVEPVAARIDEPIDLEFVPPEKLASPSRQIDIDPNEEAPEPIEAGCIELGRVVYETLAVGLPLFPRSAAADTADLGEAGMPKPEGPFAKLEVLRKK